MMNAKNFIKIFGFASITGIGAFYSNSFNVKKNDESESLLNVIIVSRHGVRIILSHFSKKHMLPFIFYSLGSYPIAYYRRIRGGDVFEIRK
jgi:hypothetical protein